MAKKKEDFNISMNLNANSFMRQIKELKKALEDVDLVKIPEQQVQDWKNSFELLEKLQTKLGATTSGSTEQIRQFNTMLSETNKLINSIKISTQGNWSNLVDTDSAKKLDTSLNHIVSLQNQLRETVNSKQMSWLSQLGMTNTEVSQLEKQLTNQETKLTDALEQELDKRISALARAEQQLTLARKKEQEELAEMSDPNMIFGRGLARGKNIDQFTQSISSSFLSSATHGQTFEQAYNKSLGEAEEVLERSPELSKVIQDLDIRLEDYYKELQQVVDRNRQTINDLQNTIKEEKKLIGLLGDQSGTLRPDVVAQAQAQTQAYQVISSGTSQAQWAQQYNVYDQNTIQQIIATANEATNQVNRLTTANISATQATSQLSEAQEQMNQKTMSMGKAVEQTEKKIEQSTQAEQKSTATLKSMSSTSNSLTKTLGSLGSFFSASGAISLAVQQIRTAINETEKLDKSLSSIAMVTSYSMSDMWNQYDQYMDLANEMGVAIADVVDASALFYQQGLDTADALNLTTEALKLATLADMSFTTATTEITGAVRSFRMEMDEAETVVDVYSNLAASAAAGVEDISEAMNATASIAANAGMSFENTSAYLTKMIETTQESASSIGTSLKTIIANFTQMTSEVSNDDADEELSINSVDEALRSVGISLRDSYGQIRNLDEIIDELGQSWDTLDRNTQRYLATTIAGTRQQSRLIALLDDYDRTLELEEIAADSAGQSNVQFAKYEDTLAYKTEELSNAFTELRNNFVNSDIIATVLDAITSAIQGLNAMPTPVLIALGVAIVALGKKIIKSILSPIRETTAALKELIGILKTDATVNVAVKGTDKGMEEVEEFLSNAQSYAESHPVRWTTQMPSETPELWENLKTEQRTNVARQRMQVRAAGESMLNNVQTPEARKELATLMTQIDRQFQQQIGQLSHQLTEGIASNRSLQGVPDSQKGTYQLLEQQLEKYYSQYQNLLNRREKAEETGRQASINKIDASLEKLEAQIREFETARASLRGENNLPTTDSLKISGASIYKDFENGLKLALKNSSVINSSSDADIEALLKNSTISSQKASTALADLLNDALGQMWINPKTSLSTIAKEEDQFRAQLETGNKAEIGVAWEELNPVIENTAQELRKYDETLTQLEQGGNIEATSTAIQQVHEVFQTAAQSLEKDLDTFSNAVQKGVLESTEMFSDTWGSGKLSNDSVRNLRKADYSTRTEQPISQELTSAIIQLDELLKQAAQGSFNGDISLELSESQEQLSSLSETFVEQGISELQGEIGQLLTKIQQDWEQAVGKMAQSVGSRQSFNQKRTNTQPQTWSNLEAVSKDAEKEINRVASQLKNMGSAANNSANSIKKFNSQTTQNAKEQQTLSSQTKKNAEEQEVLAAQIEKSAENTQIFTEQVQHNTEQLAAQATTVNNNTEQATQMNAAQKKSAQTQKTLSANTKENTANVKTNTKNLKEQTEATKQSASATKTADTNIKQAAISWDSFSKVLSQNATSLIANLSLMTAEIAGGASASTVFITSLSSLAPMIIRSITPALKTFTQGLKSSKTAAESATAALKAFNKEAIILEAAVLVIEGIIALVTKLYEVIRDSTNEAKLAALSNDLETLTNNIKTQTDAVKELKSEIEDTTEAWETYQKLEARWGSLSSSEQEEYEEVANTLMENYPEMVASYDSVTGELQIWTGQMEQQLDLMQEQEKAAYTLANAYSLAKGELESLQEEYGGESSNSIGTMFAAYSNQTTQAIEDLTTGENAVLSDYATRYADVLRSTYLNDEEQKGINKILKSQGKSYDQMLKKSGVKEIFDEIGMTETLWEEEYQNSEDYKTLITDFANMIAYQHSLEDEAFTSQLLSSHEDEINSYEALLNNYEDLTLAEIQDYLQLLDDYTEDVTEELVEKVGQGTVSSFSSIGNFLSRYFSKDFINDTTFNVLQLYEDLIDELIDQDISDAMITQYVNALSKLDITQEQLNGILSFGWSNYSSSLSAQKAFVDIMEDFGMTKQEAQELYEVVTTLQESSGVYEYTITTSVELSSNLTEWRNSLEEAVSNLEAHVTITEADLSDDLTASALASYRDSLIEQGYTDDDWLNTFYIDDQGNLQLNEAAQIGMIESEYEQMIATLQQNRENAWVGLQQQQQIVDELSEADEGYEEAVQQLEELQKEYDSTDFSKNLEFANTYFMESFNELLEDEESELEDLADDLADAEQDLVDAEKELADAEKELEDSLKDLADTINALNELLYGSSNRASSLDVLYNYTTLLDAYQSQSERMLNDFSSSQERAQTENAWTQYSEAQHNTLVAQQAEQQVIEEGLNNLTSWFNTAVSNYTATYEAEDENGVLQTVTEQVSVNYGDYVTYDEATNRYMVNQQLLNQASFNDDFKDLLEQNVEDYNSYASQLEDINQSILDEAQTMQDQYKQVLQDYTNLESNVASVLQEQYQEEVNALEEKYSAMEEADNDYVDALRDAIDKQRELRDLENSYEDVAKQERQLSLMERDTSGTRRSEVLAAQEELEESRQDLLDDAVDAMIDSLEEANDTLSDMRDIELEIKQALLDDAGYWNRAAEQIVGGFETVEDYAEWMVQNSTEYLDATTTQQELLLEQYLEDGTAVIQNWALQNSKSVEEYCQITGEEVSNLVNNVGEAFTTETKRSFDEVTQQVQDDISDAVDDITDAQESVDDARESVDEARKSVDEARDSLQELQQDYDDAAAALEKYKKMVEELTDMLITSTDSAEEKIFNSSSRDTSNTEKTVTVTTEDAEATYTTGTAANEAYTRPETHTVTVTGYDSGGLVNFTGPAWVDGTQSKPEAFLSSEDTERIGRAAEIFASIPLLNGSNINDWEKNISYGDTSIDINLNIDSISSDIDIENMIDRMKDEIVQVATPERSNVILRKNYH